MYSMRLTMLIMYAINDVKFAIRVYLHRCHTYAVISEVALFVHLRVLCMRAAYSYL